MIKKIKSIKKLAVFNDFDWNKSVRNKNDTVGEFERVNILYGRNYSGKTTTSRIIRAMETGVLSDKYPNPEFNVEFQGNINCTQNSLKNHNQIIRVFNEDFVKDNLSFISNSDDSIKSFAILGDDNNRLELQIKNEEGILGAEDVGTGLLGNLKNSNSSFTLAQQQTRDKEKALEDKLSVKANKTGTGIKHNKLYGDATYNVPKLEKDIGRATSSNFIRTEDEVTTQLILLLKEEPKPIISEILEINLSFATLFDDTKILLEKKISISEPIQELLNDALLQDWVRSGRQHHDDNRKTCGFCGSLLPMDLREKLDRHFNKESEELRTSIESMTHQIAKEMGRATKLNGFNEVDFYSFYKTEFKKLIIELENTSKKYIEKLTELNDALDIRIANIFIPISIQPLENFSSEISNILSNFEILRAKSNAYTGTLAKKQQDAKTTLRLNDVLLFSENIQYSKELAEISELTTSESTAKDETAKAALLVKEQREKINALKSQLRDESKGADRVNFYLNHFFGHDALSLKAEESEGRYRFEVIRNDNKAHHLSEGECSLVAFCYFMAKLEDIETKNNSPIIWIDDPISSLDENHIFFLFSLIDNEIVKNDTFKQLFISTHNLDFLKYLKRLYSKDLAGKDIERRYFIIEKGSTGSIIRLMPSYLKDYVTEFNYLFHQVYKCATADTNSIEINHDCFYNYANNARKFLEAYLYYRYPNANEKDNGKLSRFFGDNPIAATITNRLNNEYSHLEGIFERSIAPIDVPEMKKVAQFILDKIEEKDPDQYKALLESIGVPT
ncbi:MAG: AAA family ATPase [Glaciimonas sp.]|nr:AAA family ATPase [Glaciimonas sp.]